MAGMFDDLIPKAPGAAADTAPAPAGGGMFDDLIPKKEAGPMSWSDVGSQALSNAPASAGQFASDLVQPFVHPIDTVNSFKDLGLGVMEKLGIKGGNEHEKHADAVGQFFKDRYGSVEGFKKTMATDPVGFASDLSVLLSGGSALAARAPGIGAQVAKAASTASRAVDPLSAVGALAKGAAKVSAYPLGFTTGAGPEALRIAANAGAEGGEAGRAFRENLRGQESAADIVGEARQATSKMRQERGADYRSGMADIRADPTVLNFDKIDKSLADISAVKTFKGQIISPTTQGIRQQIGEAVRDWKHLDPAEFHTAEGLDALKQKIGDIRDGTQHGTPERLVAEQAYRSIRQTIVDQAPQYGKVMKGYEEASKQIREIDRTLSLNPNASIDTAMRKLLSTLRNNVNTNYGARGELAKLLVDAGAPHLMEKLAGQTLQSVLPRGLRGALTAAGEASAGAYAGVAGGGLAALKVLPLLATSSPRIMGGAAHLAGRASNLPARTAGRAAFQAGRLANQPLRLTVHPNPLNPYAADANPYQP